MKTYKINEQIIEDCTLKEIKEIIMQDFIENRGYLSEDESLYIEYKDGSYYYLCSDGEDGKFKKTGIKKVVIDNAETYQIYGHCDMRIMNDGVVMIN